MKKLLNIAMLLAIGTTTFAQKDTIRVEMVKAAGPFIQQNVLTTTEKDANDKAYDQHELHWEIPMDMNMWKKAASDGVKELHATDSTGFVIQEKGIYQLGFTIDNFFSFENLNVLLFCSATLLLVPEYELNPEA